MSKTGNILLFVGPPGAGKGTLAQLCAEKLGYKQLSTGNLCREHIAQQSEIGQKIDLIIKSGKLIDDSLVTSMVTDWLERGAKNQAVILDGFPRTVIQAGLFDSYIMQTGVTRPLVVRLALAQDIIVDRLSMRVICSKQECQTVYSLANESTQPQALDICDKCASPLKRRPDDEPDAIRQRLKLYDVHESELLGFYQKQQYPLVQLDAARPVEHVFDSLIAHLEKHA